LLWILPRRLSGERSADIRSDLGQASNAGQRQNRRNPSGAKQKGHLAASLARCSPMKGMRRARFLPSAPSASTRGLLQYFNSLLIEKPNVLREAGGLMMRCFYGLAPARSIVNFQLGLR
jgi:hypothetical protein